MNGLLKNLGKTEEFSRFLEFWKSGNSCRVAGAPGSSAAFILSQAFLRSPFPFLAVSPDITRAHILRQEIEGFLGESIDLFPALEVLPEDDVTPYTELLGERYRILAHLLQPSGGKTSIITTPAALIQALPSREEFKRRVLTVEAGREMKLTVLVKWLVKAGFEPADPVLVKGQFARRGGIVDLYPGHTFYPVRLEFYGDSISTLRYFDPQNQRSIRTLSRLDIFPARPAQQRRRATLGDYLPPGYKMVWIEHRPAAEMKDILSRSGDFPAVFFSSLDFSPPGKEIQLAAEFSIHTLEKYKYSHKGMVHPLLEALPLWLDEGLRCLIYSHNPGESRRLKEILRERGIAPGSRLRFLLGEVEKGFIWEEARLVVMADGEIFSRYRIPRPRQKFTARAAALKPADFYPGDYVVHIDQGVGRYLGVVKLETAGEKQDKLAIQYADQARLYLPLTQAHLISRYSGLGKKPPVLDRLGGARWLRAKVAAQRAVEDLASRLLEVEAQREILPGHAFSPDTAWQKEFEAAFIYPETVDQNRTLEEIKKDMESAQPMDRLLCGDVGYGKTEVAVRAAFKAVMDGKQVAILVPTTVLAQQHFETFRERMADYPVRLEMLSRFLNRREQRPVVEGLIKGSVDIVIGTHRLLQPDIKFRRLGLVVIDEEQRFGVAHKERFKQMRKLVDVLTLTATPIPRTLYLSLTGARDLSSIDTPPPDRLAVETRVRSYDPEVVRRAISRELGRKGQVYYLFNRVEGIERVKERLQEWFPDKRVAVAHGQMDEKELARVMKLFSRGVIDILVCTTIIESGLDIPNANTIMVERADRFGLADLYQLRGRVGRFQHRAYAYFFYPPHFFLQENARKRLRALVEFSHLGAGYGLALRDLEIRGAGNILGRQQHGHIAAVGFELYCRLLQQSIRKLKGQTKKFFLRVRLEFKAPGELPSDYVQNEAQRIEMYRKWAGITGREALGEWLEELKDRFGPPPEEAVELAAEAELKLAAEAKGITNIQRVGNKYVFRRGKKILATVAGEASGLVDSRPPWREMIKRLKTMD